MAANQVDDFRVQLENMDKEFVCQTPLPATSANVFFLGPFQGQVILWNMTLAILSHSQANDSAISQRPFIEIRDANDGVFEIQVGLDLPMIDEAVIKKTIIMIRNYRRLAIGRIEFGSMHA